MPTITNLPILTTATTATLVIVVDTAGVPTTKRASFAQIQQYFSETVAVNSVAGKQGNVELYYTDINGTPLIATSSTVGAIRPGLGLVVDSTGTLNVSNTVASVYMSTSTANIPNIQGIFWWDETTGRLYINYAGAWVDASPANKPFVTNTFSYITINSGVASTTTNTGALIVEGGVGISGDVNVGGTIYSNGYPVATTEGSTLQLVTEAGSSTTNAILISNTASNALTVYGGIDIGQPSNIQGSQIVTAANIGQNIPGLNATMAKGDYTFFPLSIFDSTPSVSTTTGALNVAGGVGVGGDIYFKGNLYQNGVLFSSASTSTTNTFTVKNLTPSASTDSGAIVVTGGVGIGGDLHVGGQIYGALGTGTYSISNATQSYTSSTGALTVTGGAGIGGNLNVGGQSVFIGTATFIGPVTYLNSTETVYTNNLLILHEPPSGITGTWAINDGFDIGFEFRYFTNTDTTAGLVLKNSSGYLEWISGNYNSGAAVYGTFKTGAVAFADGSMQTTAFTGIPPIWSLSSSTGAQVSLTTNSPSGLAFEINTGTFLIIDDPDGGVLFIGGYTFNTSTNLIYSENDPLSLYASNNISITNVEDISGGGESILLGASALPWSTVPGSTGTITLVASSGSNAASWAFGSNGRLTFPNVITAPVGTTFQSFGMGNLFAWEDGPNWVISSGNPSSGAFGENGISICPGIEGSTYFYLPPDSQSATQPVQLANYSGQVLIQTVNNSWAFEANGSLTFPDGTTSTTAWNTSTAVWPSQIIGGVGSGSNASGYQLTSGTYAVSLDSAVGALTIPGQIIGSTTTASVSVIGGSIGAGNTVVTVNTGSTYNVSNNVPTIGGHGTGLTVNITSVDGNGSIVAVSVNNGGSGYRVNDILNIVGGNSDGTVKVTGITGTGVYYNEWQFIGTNSSILFPDGTVQPTAYPGISSMFSNGTWTFALEANGSLSIPGTISVATNSNITLQNQDGIPYWINTYGDLDFNVNNDAGNSVVYDNDGNIIVCVTENTDAGYPTPHIVKYDRSGNILWKNYINEFGIGAMTGSAEAAAVDSDNNIYVLVTDNVNSITWVFQLNSNGSVLNQIIIQPGTAEFFDIAIDSSNNIYITGYQDAQLIIASVNFSGIIWQTALDITSGTDLGFNIAVDGFSNIYVVGQGTDSGQTAILIKLNSSGVLQWMQGFGDQDGIAKSVVGVAVDSSGTSYLAIENSAGGTILAKYDTGGTLLYQVTFDYGNNTSPTEIVLGDDGFLYLTGTTSNSSPYSSGIFISKFDVNLNNIWTNILVCQQIGSAPLAQWDFLGHRDISVYQDTFAITGFTTNQQTTNTNQSSIPSNVVTAQLPTDGSYTGVFDNYAYISGSYISTGTSTIVNQTLTPGYNSAGTLSTTSTSTTILAEASTLTNYQTTVKSNGIWTFDNGGNLHLPTGGKIYDSQGNLYGTQGSDVLTLTPSISPITAHPGTFAVADGVLWDPATKGLSKPYPVFWDGSAWNALY